MNTPFDPLKAAQEEVLAAIDCVKVFRRLETQVESKQGEMEQELIAAKKMLAFAQVILQEKRTALQVLQDQQSI